MSFLGDLKPIWEGPIKNAITKAGYKPYRVDAEPHSELIDVKIISEIKNSRFVVADFTYQNLGVYFETGYSQGMGLPVIRCVREDDFENLHFDKNHYNFIKGKPQLTLKISFMISFVRSSAKEKKPNSAYNVAFFYPPLKKGGRGDLRKSAYAQV